MNARYRIPSASWAVWLSSTIVAAKDGDSIVVRTAAQKAMGERARNRVCPDKHITLEVEETTPE